MSDHEYPLILPNVPVDQYWEMPYISSSGIRCFAREGPYSYWAKYVKRIAPSSDSESKRLGSLLHFAIDNQDWESRLYSEPETIEDDEVFAELEEGTPEHFAPGEKVNKRSPIHREYLRIHAEKFCDMPDGLHLKPGDDEHVKRQIDAIVENPESRELFDSQGETECAAVNEQLGLNTKCLVDKLIGRLGVDWKTTRHTTANAFIYDAWKLGYHFQSEWYKSTASLERFLIVSVTSTEYPEAMVYEVPRIKAKEARDANLYHLQSIKDCMDTDSWHSLYWGSIVELDPSERLAQ